MSETRDDSTGQFSSDAPVFGLESVEREQGYVPYKEETTQEDPEELTVAEAAERYNSRTPEADIRTHSPLDLPDNVSLTVDQAHKIRSDMDAADATEAADAEADRIRAEIDELRGVDAEKATAKDLELTPDKILEHPAFKETFEKLSSETEQARQTYQTNLEAATRVATATFVGQFPEFSNVPADQYGAMMSLIAQHNPARAEAIRATAANMGQLFEQHSAETKRTAQQEQAKVQTFVKAESERFEKMVGNTPKAERSEIEQGIVAKIKEYGGDMQQFINLMTKSEFSSATVQRLLWDVGKLHRMESAKKAVAAKALPSVQRPGVASSRGERRAADIGALRSKLASTGSVDDAYNLYVAQKARRG